MRRFEQRQAEKEDGVACAESDVVSPWQWVMASSWSKAMTRQVTDAKSLVEYGSGRCWPKNKGIYEDASEGLGSAIYLVN